MGDSVVPGWLQATLSSLGRAGTDARGVERRGTALSRRRGVLQARLPVVEVAARYGVSRKSVHAWVRRYQQSGLAGLADRSHRPHHQPRQVPAEVEAAICRLRIAHPKWGPRRIEFELGRNGCPGRVPSRSTVYRVLVRNHFVTARPRKRRRQDYKRWERPAPMQLWQLDIVDGVLADGREYKLVSGVDDHSRFCVIATVVARATGRAVCTAFARALTEYGVPEQVLTDNGKQFTGKYSRPRPTEVLFDRICRKDGIEHLLTKPRTPTTTGKVERWHQTLQNEFLHEQQAPFASLAAAQAAVDAWRAEYNTTRPHQSLDMASPADRFRAVPPAERADLPLWLPADLTPLPAPAVPAEPAAVAPTVPPAAVIAHSAAHATDAVEVDRVVPASGNLQVAGQQFWLGPQRAGQPVTLWIGTTTVHVTVAGQHLKTLPSRLSAVDLARLRTDGARPAGPPPARPSPGLLAAGATVEIDRLVHAQGVVVLAGRQLPVGSPLAGRRVTLRLDPQLVHVIVDGKLWRTIAFALPPTDRARLRGARLPGPPPAPADTPIRVQRRVSSRGGIQVVGQRVHVGFHHAGATVTIDVEDTMLRVLDQHDQVLTVVPRTSRKEVSRYKAYGHTQPAPA